MNNPSLYVRANKLQKNTSIEIMKEYSHIFKWKNDGSDTFIDIGCGPGDVTNDIIIPYLPKNYESIVGCDISKRMIEYAEQHKIDSRSSFIELDIATKDLNLKEVGIYDHLASFFCLQWVPDQEKALKNIYKLLQPDGDFLIVLVISSSVFDIYLKLLKITKWEKLINITESSTFVSPYNSYKNPGIEFERVIRGAGFTDFKYEIRKKSVLFETISEFKDFFGGIMPFYSQGSQKEEEEEFLRESVKLATEMNLKYKNGMEIFYDVFICHGKK